MSVLIVEDNAHVREMLRAIVGPVAGAVHECDDGLAAADAYGRVHPDWVLMDLHLPGQDGISATRSIRAADASARIIIVTQHDDAALRDAASAAGACAYVLKDNLSSILAVITR